jgi:hypothetical protein
MNSLSIFSTWGIGVLHGYKPKEKEIPRSITYSTIGITSMLYSIKAIGNAPLPLKNIKPTTILGGILVFIPMKVRSVFCVGHQVGKAIQYKIEEADKKLVELNRYGENQPMKT